MTSMTEGKKPHDGRNVKRIREILQVKQSTLAHALGEDWNQKKVSQLEDKETIEDVLLEEIAGALKVPVEAIKNYDESATITIISSTLHDQAGSVFNNAVINPVERWIEALEENKKLYERLLQSEKEKVEMLQSNLNERK